MRTSASPVRARQPKPWLRGCVGQGSLLALTVYSHLSVGAGNVVQLRIDGPQQEAQAPARVPLRGCAGRRRCVCEADPCTGRHAKCSRSPGMDTAALGFVVYRAFVPTLCNHTVLSWRQPFPKCNVVASQHPDIHAQSGS